MFGSSLALRNVLALPDCTTASQHRRVAAVVAAVVLRSQNQHDNSAHLRDLSKAQATPQLDSCHMQVSKLCVAVPSSEKKKTLGKVSLWPLYWLQTVCRRREKMLQLELCYVGGTFVHANACLLSFQRPYHHCQPRLITPHAQRLPASAALVAPSRLTRFRGTARGSLQTRATLPARLCGWARTRA